MTPDIANSSTTTDQALRVLIIDDDPLLPSLIGSIMEMLGHTWQSANNPDDALLALKEAEKSKNPFSIVTIDMKFDVGKNEVPMLIGKTILQKIKSQYPHIACIVISGSGVAAHEVLDLRDEYGLDYYISKDRLDKDTLDRGIKRALRRVKIIKNINSASLSEVTTRSLTPSVVLEAPLLKAEQVTPSTVFVSYSHKDEEEKDKLLSHLGVLGNANLIDVWSDDQIGAGADWEAEINQAINSAKVAILMVSVNFLNSKFILQKEVPELLKRREKEGITIFPVIAKACAWRKIEWLAKMNVRPKNGHPVWSDSGSHVDDDLAAIAEEVADILSS